MLAIPQVKLPIFRTITYYLSKLPIFRAITYLSNNKGVLNLHEPPLTKTCTNDKQFLKQPLEFSYPNHTQAMVSRVKLTTKATSRKAGQKRQMGEDLCTLTARKK